MISQMVNLEQFLLPPFIRIPGSCSRIPPERFRSPHKGIKLTTSAVDCRESPAFTAQLGAQVTFHTDQHEPSLCIRGSCPLQYSYSTQCHTSRGTHSTFTCAKNVRWTGQRIFPPVFIIVTAVHKGHSDKKADSER